MSCEYCTPRLNENGVINECVGEWCFDADDTLNAGISCGRVTLWYDDEDGWAMTLLVDGPYARKHGKRELFPMVPATATLAPKVCPFCGRELVKPKWLWRLEATDPAHGLWYDGNGNWVWDMGKLGCTTKDLPMDYDWRYQQDGRQWWSACSSKADLLHWYSPEDVELLRGIGFVMARYWATEYHEYELETPFIKETCLAREEVPLDGLWD